jgi:hypothetical protein
MRKELIVNISRIYKIQNIVQKTNTKSMVRKKGNIDLALKDHKIFVEIPKKDIVEKLSTKIIIIKNTRITILL